MKPLLIITGPTASGKSTFAMQLARQCGGEIVSADSMQIYRHCNIATAKPSPQERQEIPHYLLDLVNPDQQYSAALWARAARSAIADIGARGKTPIVAGGTGFYLRAFLEPQSLAEVPPDEQLRAQLEQYDNAALYQKLREVDTQAAARLDTQNRPRLICAIEVAQGKKVLLKQDSQVNMEYRAFALHWPRQQLYQRINQRVDAMMEAGFMEELRFLADRFGPAAPALCSIGYRQMLPVLENPALEAAQIELWKQATRRYAKRQLTWFRHQLKVEWLDGANPTIDEVSQLFPLPLGEG